MTSGRKRKRHERDASNSDNGVVACDGPVRRDLLRHAYATVLTLREYALLKLPSSSRLRRKKISSLGKGNSVSELEAAVSEFLDSTLICDSKAILQTDNASYAQWLSFSQNGDESHVTISGDLPESENTLSEVCIIGPHRTFGVVLLLIGRASSWTLPYGPISIGRRRQVHGRNTFSVMDTVNEPKRVILKTLPSQVCGGSIRIITLRP